MPLLGSRSIVYLQGDDPLGRLEYRLWNRLTHID